MELTTLARWTIRPRLMAVPGVANVAIWGQRDRQFQVLVDPERLRAHERHARRRGRGAPATPLSVGAGGFVDTPNQRLAVAPPRSRSHDAEDLARVPVALPRRRRRSRSATWPRSSRGIPPPIGDAIINDGPGLLLIVEKQPWGNTLDVTRDVEAALEALRPALGGRRDRLDHLPPGDLHRDVARQPQRAPC